MELGDVVLARHQHAAGGVGARAHRRLGPLTGGEVLLVHPVEQLDRGRQVLPRGNHGRVEQPVARDHGPVGRQRRHPHPDHVVRHQVDEDLGPDRHRVVPPVLFVAHPRQAVEPGPAVDGEPVRPVGERGAVPDVVLGRVAARELGQHAGQLGVDRSAVIALHEVLHDQLPVRRDVVADPPPDRERADRVGVDRRGRAQPGGDRAGHRDVERRRRVGQADPGVAQPLPQRDRHQSVGVPVDVGHAGQVRGRRQPPAQLVGPGVVGAAQVAGGLSGRLQAQPGPAVAAHVEEGAQLAVGLTDDQHALRAGRGHEELARGGDLVRAGHAQPLPVEDGRPLALENLGVGVPGPGQGGHQAPAGRGRSNGIRWHRLVHTPPGQAEKAGPRRREKPGKKLATVVNRFR